MPTLSQTAPSRPIPPPGFWDSLRSWARPATFARSRRVCMLLVAIALMSLGDLYMTLTYLDAGGMSEANPVARWLMLHGSPSVLVSWKLLTVIVACSILFYTRRFRAAELAAWASCLLLTWLTLHWHTYVEEISRLTPVIHQLAEADPNHWVPSTP